MKNRNFIQIIVLISVISNLNCNYNEKKGIWLQVTDCCNSPFNHGINILEFEEDSLMIKTFFEVGVYWFNWNKEVDIEAKEIIENIAAAEKVELFRTGQYFNSTNELNFSIKDEVYNFKVKRLGKEKMVLKGDYTNCRHNDEKEYEIDFLRLPRYNQAKNREKLNTLLQKNFYELKVSPKAKCIEEDRIKIDFFENNHFQFSEMKGCSYPSSGQFWYIDEYKGEVFLVFGLASPYPVHIKSITDEKIIGVIHEKEDITLEFFQIPIKQEFTREELKGKWVEKNPKLPPPPPPPFGIFYEREYLEIGENYIIQNRFHRSDTLEYQMGKLDEFLIFPENWGNFDNRRWEIISLSKNELDLRRRSNIAGLTEYQSTKFERKN